MLHNMNSLPVDEPHTFVVGEPLREGAARGAAQEAAWFPKKPNMASAAALAGNQRHTTIPTMESSSVGVAPPRCR
jgi:hypothetical protein